MRENSLLANTSRSQTLLPNIAEKLGPMCGLFHFIVQYKLIRDSAQSNTPWGQTKALSFADINFGFYMPPFVFKREYRTTIDS